MKFGKLKYVGTVLLFSLGLAGAGSANEENPRPVRVSGAGSKIEYCTYCHGASGQGYRAYFTMPRLAGQTPEYLINQLNAYADGSRKNIYMHKVARNLSPSMRSAIARHFSALGAKPVARDGEGRSSEGRKIYQEGLPEANIAACAACHGTAGEGTGAIPRLAGQLSGYTQKTLANWSRERGHGGNAAVMAPVAASLSKSQVAAVASYLSGLK